MPKYTPTREDVELEALLRDAKKRASDLSRDLDAANREIKAAREEAAQVGPLEATVAEQKATIAGLTKGVAAANRARKAAELKLAAKPVEWHSAVHEALEGGMKYDRADLQAGLPDGWYLSHFCDGSGGRKEWYSAARENSSAMQSAASQTMLIQRIESWEAEQASREPAPVPVQTAAKPPPSKAVAVKSGTVAA